MSRGDFVVIGVCGYGYTGSGAVIDLLKEYETIKVFDDFEFTITYWPDALEDLEYHLLKQPDRFFSSDVALRRFKAFAKKEMISPNGWYKKATNGKFGIITEKYLNDITQLSWKGRWMIDPYFCNEFIRTIKYRIVGRLISKSSKLRKLLDREMLFSVCPNNFHEISMNYVGNILKEMGALEDDVIVLNQPFPANNPEYSMSFYSNPKAIIVDRDPRDTYLLMKLHTVARWAPMDDVNKFIIYYKQLRLRRSSADNVLYLNFEDLIYNYSSTVSKIEEFCGISNNTNVKKFFDPSISIANTQLFLKYPEFKDDFQIIEKELEQYLYDFPDIREKNTSYKIF